MYIYVEIEVNKIEGEHTRYKKAHEFTKRYRYYRIMLNRLKLSWVDKVLQKYLTDTLILRLYCTPSISKPTSINVKLMIDTIKTIVFLLLSALRMNVHMDL